MDRACDGKYWVEAEKSKMPIRLFCSVRIGQGGAGRAYGTIQETCDQTIVGDFKCCPVMAGVEKEELERRHKLETQRVIKDGYEIKN